MSIEFTPRKVTNRINVHIRKNQLDLTIQILDIMARRKDRRLDSGYHLVVRQSGDIEKGRSHEVVGGWFHDAIEINVICKGDEPTDSQTATITALLNHLNTIYPEAQTHYA